jgi:MFS family permease
MLGLRVVLGVFEAGYFPGCVYLLSTWYTRYELQQRNAIFFIVGGIPAALSGIAAYGILQMGGLGNLSGWRWIFIVGSFLHLPSPQLTPPTDRRSRNLPLWLPRVHPNS